MTSWVVYLARPLDAALHWHSTVKMAEEAFNREQVRGRMLDEIRQELDAVGAQVYDPGTALLVPEPDGNPFAQHVHDAALEHCDGVLAWLPDGVPTIGVPLEIAKALSIDKPVVVLGGKHALKSTSLASLGVPVYASADGAVAGLVAAHVRKTDDLAKALQTGPDEAAPAATLQELVTDMAAALQSDPDRFTVGYSPMAGSIHPPMVGIEVPLGETGELISDDTEPWVAAASIFMAEVMQELRDAVDKHPKSNDPEWTTTERWFGIWVEEAFEAVQAYNDRRDIEEIQAEIVQVAAMACRWWASYYGV
jgi:hypothetical protein